MAGGRLRSAPAAAPTKQSGRGRSRSARAGRKRPRSPSPVPIPDHELDPDDLYYREGVAADNVEPARFGPAFNQAIAPMFERLGAMIENIHRFKMNGQAFSRPGSRPVLMPFKINAGFAEPPPQGNAARMPADVAAVFRAPAPRPGPGVVPPPCIAVWQNTDDAVTSDQIGFLCRWYNATAGIQPGDSEQERRQKLQSFFCGLNTR